MSFDQLEEIFCGELGYKPWEFYQVTPREANNILNGYRRKELEQFKIQAQFFRDLEFTIISPYIDEKNPKHPKTKFDFKQFYWEKEINEIEPGRKLKTKAEIQAIWQKLDKNKVDNNGR